jgi:hypothetical protein
MITKYLATLAAAAIVVATWGNPADSLSASKSVPSNSTSAPKENAAGGPALMRN